MAAARKETFHSFTNSRSTSVQTAAGSW